MIHTKRVIFMILPLLFVPLVYGLSSTPDACAAPKAAPSNADCWVQATGGPAGYTQTCCWEETDPSDPEGIELTYCQLCDYDPSTKTVGGCGEKFQQGPTLPPSGPVAPLQGGVLEQPEQPLFGGQNDAGVPPTGGIEQPPMTTTPQIPPRLPGGGANVPTEGGSAEQPPTPQDDNQGGGLPPIKNQENVPPGGGVADQPEDDGQQEDSSEGAETAGPLT